MVNMDKKCRICLKYQKKLRSIYSKENGITFAVMISSISHVKIEKDDLISKLICVSCCQKLGHAFSLKLDIERSDSILQQQNNKKKINFSNIDDILIVIDIEGKPTVPVIDAKPEQLFKNGEDYVTYNDITIKKVTKSAKPEKSLSVQEFLNSIKFEEESGEDEIGDTGEYFDSGSNYSLDMKPKIKNKKYLKHNKKNKENMYSKKNNCLKGNGQIIEKPIKPKYLRDIIVMPFKKDPVKKKKREKTNKNGGICPYCGKLYTNINLHILTHSANKMYKCDTCSKSFYSMPGLRKHTLLHIHQRQYKCEQCVAAFPDKAGLQSHMRTHSEERKHICDMCSKGFKRRNALQRHLNTIHNLGPKPVTCELCTMMFNTIPAMRHHMRVHTGERPYNCEMCSQPYSYKRDFNRHCLNKHGVYLNRRPVNVMNEIVLQREKAVMKELMLKANGVLSRDELPESFDGPQGALAFEQAMIAIKTMQIPVCDANGPAPLCM